MNQEKSRPSAEEVIAKVEAWLKTPGAIESLQQAFAEADKLAHELTVRTRLDRQHPHPLLGPIQNRPRLGRGFLLHLSMVETSNNSLTSEG